jgi:hypothetical protein
VLSRDAVLFGLAGVVILALYLLTGYPYSGKFVPGWLSWVFSEIWSTVLFLLVCLGAAGWLHMLARKWSASAVARLVAKTYPYGPLREGLLRAFYKNTAPWRSIFRTEPAGWGIKYRKLLVSVIADSERFIQTLNDRYAHPSGVTAATVVPPPAEPEPEGEGPAQPA